jgi:CxxC motif-containing protein (DUF1111 family)
MLFLSKEHRRRIGMGCVLAVCASTATIQGQKDPGPRGGPAGAGSYYVQLSANEQAFFTQALERFKEIDSVSGTIPGETGSGLGPAYNGNSCAMCHAQPAVGGSSPGFASKQNPVPNPQVALATLHGGTNIIPSFITAQGPVREARFVALSNQNNAPPDGSVHDLYTISGRTDAGGCQMQQPDFAAQLANNNVVFRIPTPLYGLGFVEATPDAVLQANLAANQQAKAALGICGRLNTSGNDQTVTRFGWKAQNKSLLIFAGEAYNVEQGVSNEAFPNKRSTTPNCIYNGTPEDSSNMTNPVNYASVGTVSEMSSDIVNFAGFIRLSAPPVPVTASPSELNGQALFSSIGCAMCHSPALTTGKSVFTGMSNFTYHPYSDFALHHMGSNLADGISQGAAGPDEFRTAPLWGVGQRLFFLHDGRTSDLLHAIEAHADSSPGCGSSNQRSQFGQTAAENTCSSEANAVISQFHALSAGQRQDILNFLRSL